MSAELHPKRNPPDAFDKAELACRAVNVAWTIVAGRLPWRSHVERLKDLQAAGLVNDESYFAAHGQAARE